MKAQQETERREGKYWFTVHVVAFLFVLVLALFRYAPPQAKGPEVAGDVFSAGRVRGLLERVIRPGVPHSTGSADHGRMRDAVIEEFRGLGLEPEIQDTFAVTDYGHAEQVQNIVVHMRGTVGDDAIGLVTHYDSVPAGPGVADDGSGVGSILEIARILTEGPPPRNDVIFLITDAEELGLRGARAFAAEHPLMGKIRAVLNWEARGTRGPSFMFETGPNNLGLVRLMARHCRRSISTSLFSSIYDLLPNDTDLTVFKGRGIAGLNYAFIGGSPHYHTPLDNMENLDLGSVQHQGEHFLAMARVLSDARLDDMAQQDAVFFDVLGWFTFWWPEAWNPAFAIGVAVLAVLVLVMTLRRSDASVLGVAVGLLAWPLGLVVVGVAGEGAYRLVVACTGEPAPWWAWAQPMCVVLWCVGMGIPIAAWRWIGRRVSGEVSTGVMIVYWAALGILLAWYLPGGSYLFTVPAVVACVFRLVALWRGFRWEAANLVFVVAACVLWLPMARGLVDALGVAPSFGQTIPLALMGLLIAPTAGAEARIFRFLLLVFGLSVAALGVAMVVPTYSERWPQQVSIVYGEDDRQAYLTLHAHPGQIPSSLRQSGLPVYQFNSPHHLVLDAGVPVLDGPTLEVQADEVVEGGRRLRLLLKPGVGQHRVILSDQSGLGWRVAVNGRSIATPLKRLALNFSEAAEAEIELTVEGSVELTVEGYRYDLPPSAESLREARPVWAVPSVNGDYTHVVRVIGL